MSPSLWLPGAASHLSETPGVTMTGSPAEFYVEWDSLRHDGTTLEVAEQLNETPIHFIVSAEKGQIVQMLPANLGNSKATDGVIHIRALVVFPGDTMSIKAKGDIKKIVDFAETWGVPREKSEDGSSGHIYDEGLKILEGTRKKS